MTQPGESPAAIQLQLITTPIKSKPRTSREFERALRELGFSKSESRAIACHGFKGLDIEDPGEDASDQLVSLLKRTLTAIEHERPTP